MPLLKDLSCSIELSDDQQTLQEFGTTYGDGFVETFVAVPSKPRHFSVHLTSNKFIAPGIALYVFIDGVYQCNRNRQDLKLRKPSDSRSLIDFRVRQKEEKQQDGSMIAREWTFEKLNSVSADEAPSLCSSNILENIGCIEVIVLRCAGPRSAKTASHINLDGASDSFDHYFGLDGQPQGTDVRSTYDDRAPFVTGFSIGSGQPTRVSSYRSPYVETVRSHDGTTSRTRRSTHIAKDTSPPASMSRQSRPHSRYSEPISLGGRPHSSIPPPGFQYGSGPIPTEGQPFHHPPPSAIVTNAPIVDSVWLDKLLTKAVKQGVEESRRNEPPPVVYAGHKEHKPDMETASQPPGAWPMSPFSTTAQSYLKSEPVQDNMHSHDADRGTTWGHSQRGWDQRQPGSRRATQVTWNAEPVWESDSNANEWNSPEETPDDSWDTDETWATKRSKELEASNRRGRSRAPTAQSYFASRPGSPVAARGYNRHRSKEDRSWRSRPKSRSQRSGREDERKSSSEDNEGWTHIDAASDSVASWDTSDNTVQPSRSRSGLRTPRKRAERRSYHSKSAQSDRERKSSQHTRHAPPWQPAPTHVEPAPSVITRVTPTVMNAPASAHSIIPSEAHSRKASIHTEPAVPVVPPPTWGCAAPDKTKKTSYASTYVPPAPYAPSLHDFGKDIVGDNRVDSSPHSLSSWGSGKKEGGAQESWGSRVEKTADWNDAGDSGWENTNTGEQDKNGWAASNNDQKGAWNTTHDPKDVQSSGWDTKDTGWDAENTSKEQKDSVVAADAWEVNKDNWNTAKGDDAPWADGGHAWNNQDTNHINNTVQWNTGTLGPAAPALDNHAKAASTSKRHTSKSLSKYRQLRSASSDLTPKAHWQFPPPPSKTKLSPTPEDHNSSKVPYVAPREPLYKISKETATEKGVEHQVRAGKGIQYGHVIGRPEYLDRLDKPYAVFRFKYRSRAILKSMFGDKVPDSGHLTLPTPGSTITKAKEKLKDLPQDQLIEKMLKLQNKLAHKEQERRESTHKQHRHKHDKPKERRASDATEIVARNLTESWVQQHSRDPSEKSKSKSKSSSVGKEKEEAKQAWEQTAEGDGAWPNTTW